MTVYFLQRRNAWFIIWTESSWLTWCIIYFSVYFIIWSFVVCPNWAVSHQKKLSHVVEEDKTLSCANNRLSGAEESPLLFFILMLLLLGNMCAMSDVRARTEQQQFHTKHKPDLCFIWSHSALQYQLHVPSEAGFTFRNGFVSGSYMTDLIKCFIDHGRKIILLLESYLL